MSIYFIYFIVTFWFFIRNYYKLTSFWQFFTGDSTRAVDSLAEVLMSGIQPAFLDMYSLLMNSYSCLHGLYAFTVVFLSLQTSDCFSKTSIATRTSDFSYHPAQLKSKIQFGNRAVSALKWCLLSHFISVTIPCYSVARWGILGLHSKPVGSWGAAGVSSCGKSPAAAAPCQIT